jgi:HK97 family phage major capsid protein
MNLKTAEARTALEKLQQQEKDITEHLSALKRVEDGIARAANEQQRSQIEAIPAAISAIPNAVARVVAANEGRSEQRLQELRKSYLNFIKGEKRDVTSANDTAGEALVPQEFGVLTTATKLYGVIASLVNVNHESNGRASKQPITSDVTNFATIVGQGNSVAEADPTVFSQTPTSTADSIRTKVIASLELAADATAGGGLENYLTQLFGVRIGRSLEHIVTLGTDPAGNQAAASPTGGLLASLSPLTTTTALANGLQWTDFVNAFSAIDPSYLRSAAARVFMNWNTMMTLAAIKDTTGRSLFVPNAQGGIDSILGVKTELNQALPNIAANSTPVIVGDVSKAYSLTLSGLKTQRFSQAPELIDTNSVELIGYVRASASTLLPSAAGVIKIAAS